MNDEQSDHAHHLLHRHVRVIEERSVLMDSEFVYERVSRRDRILCESGNAVHGNGHFETVPVNREQLWEAVLDNDT